MSNKLEPGLYTTDAGDILVVEDFTEPNADGSYADATPEMVEAGILAMYGEVLSLDVPRDELRNAVRAAYRRMVIMDSQMMPVAHAFEER